MEIQSAHLTPMSLCWGKCVHTQVVEGNNKSEQAIPKTLHNNLLKMKLFFVKFEV